MKAEVKRALMSVTDKRGVEEFARELSGRGVEIIASGGTAAAISKEGIPVTEISDITGFPEIMDGRVKTLHPKIHGGILADREKKEHISKAQELGIGLIDIVAVNLYRFREASANPDLDEKGVIEEVDIGGPTLIRSAAKNYHSVAVVVDPSDYGRIIEELDAKKGSISLETRRMLASKAFHHTASYDSAISGYFDGLAADEDLPSEIITSFRKINNLRYGENPHLRAALYRIDATGPKFGDFTRLQGKELSYNNIQDMFASFLLARDLGGDSCAIIKHMNPCGAAEAGSCAASFTRAKKTDPVSAFGSVVSFNGIVDEETALLCKEIFHEVILARGFTDEAREALRKKKNLRLIIVPEPVWDGSVAGWATREAGDLMLVQDRDEGFPELDDWKIVTSKKPDARETKALIMAWKTVKHIRSNAIVICDHEGTVGVGAGQMSRVDSCRIAVDKARREGMKIEGTSAGSDAFFPFPDGVQALAEAGVKAVIQPGGSIRDEEVIKAAEELGISMVLTGRRHFRH